MALEAKHKVIGDSVVFKETFSSNADIVKNGGMPTAVSISNGVGTFDGSSSNILYQGFDTTQTSINAVFSVRFIFKLNDTSTSQIMLDTGTGTNDRVAISINANILRSGIYNGSSYIYKKSTAFTDTNDWHELVISFTGSVLSVYLDNVEMAGTDNPIASDGGVLAVGSSNTSTVYSNIEVDSVEIHDKALTASEVANLYNKTQHKGLITKGLQGYWDLTKGSSFDRSNNGNDGVDTAIDYKKQGAEFNGSTSLINVGQDSSLNSQDLTAFYVVRRSSDTTRDGLFFDGTAGSAKDHNIDMEIRNTDDVLFTFGNGTNDIGTKVSTNLVLADGKNHFIAAIRDATAKTLTFVIDGVIESPQSYTLSGDIVDLAGDLTLSFSFAPFGGIQKACGLYNRALSDEDITQTYQYFKTRFNL